LGACGGGDGGSGRCGWVVRWGVGDPTGAAPGRGGGGRRQCRSVMQGGGRGGTRWDLVVAREGENRWRMGQPGERKKGGSA
jgi:hypothetical protein